MWLAVHVRLSVSMLRQKIAIELVMPSASSHGFRAKRVYCNVRRSDNSKQKHGRHYMVHLTVKLSSVCAELKQSVTGSSQ